ncbi:MAG: hypothetical protein FK734_00210 [Asgard group archaeon]|nr:hypothetical protein [Asgard group archaeon]
MTKLELAEEEADERQFGIHLSGTQITIIVLSIIIISASVLVSSIYLFSNPGIVSGIVFGLVILVLVVIPVIVLSYFYFTKWKKVNTDDVKIISSKDSKKESSSSRIDLIKK